jgi:hypothetical protein
MKTQGISQNCLDDIPVTENGVDRAVSVFVVEFPNGLNSTTLDIAQGLALCPRENRCAGMTLHDFPHRLIGERFQFLASPVAVTALDNALIDSDGRITSN